MVVATIPALLAHLVDSATTDLDGGPPLVEAVDAHRQHGRAWYGDLLGVLTVRASTVEELARDNVVAGMPVSVVADTGIDRLDSAIGALRIAGAQVRRAEASVARRGESPLPGLRRLLDACARLHDNEPELIVHAEIPLSSGLMDALDALAEAMSTPARLGATFRIGGLAGELFPPPQVLAGVICACRDRGLRFTVNAGLDRALRHNDHETGFTHHGVVNLLAACLAATAGAAQSGVAERLATNDAIQLTELVKASRDLPRPLWVSYGADRVDEIVHDLTLFDVLSSEAP
jgi:hypothetical protein